MDEFGTLQRLPTIKNLLTLSRSRGGGVLIGIQDIGQIDKLYTSQLRQTLVNACSTSVTFAVEDPDTARFLSDKIGETEYIETEETYSMGVADNRDGVSLMQRKKTEKLIIPSQITNLRDLECYVKIPNYDITKTFLSFKKYSDRNEPFLIRPDLVLEKIRSEQEHIITEAEAVKQSKKGKEPKKQEIEKAEGEETSKAGDQDGREMHDQEELQY